MRRHGGKSASRASPTISCSRPVDRGPADRLTRQHATPLAVRLWSRRQLRRSDRCLGHEEPRTIGSSLRSAITNSVQDVLIDDVRIVPSSVPIRSLSPPAPAPIRYSGSLYQSSFGSGNSMARSRVRAFYRRCQRSTRRTAMLNGHANPNINSAHARTMASIATPRLKAKPKQIGAAAVRNIANELLIARCCRFARPRTSQPRRRS